MVIEYAPLNVGYFVPSVMPITGARSRPGAIPSGFGNTVIVLFTGSGMFPAASAGPVYVMFCAPSIDVSSCVAVAVPS